MEAAGYIAWLRKVSADMEQVPPEMYETGLGAVPVALVEWESFQRLLTTLAQLADYLHMLEVGECFPAHIRSKLDSRLDSADLLSHMGYGEYE